MLMVKPGIYYLDIIRNVKQKYPAYPLFAYQVSCDNYIANVQCTSQGHLSSLICTPTPKFVLLVKGFLEYLSNYCISTNVFLVPTETEHDLCDLIGFW